MDEVPTTCNKTLDALLKEQDEILKATNPTKQFFRDPWMLVDGEKEFDPTPFFPLRWTATENGWLTARWRLRNFFDCGLQVTSPAKKITHMFQWSPNINNSQESITLPIVKNAIVTFTCTNQIVSSYNPQETIEKQPKNKDMEDSVVYFFFNPMNHEYL